MPGILWLASYPKSGNTWMRVFLANLILDPQEPLPLKAINEVCSSEPNEIWFKPLVQKPVAELSERRIAALRTKAQERAASTNKNIIPMKTHSLLGKDHGYPTISVKATIGVIYIIRDPRDVVISAADHYGLTLDQAVAMLADKTSLTCGMVTGADWKHPYAREQAAFAAPWLRVNKFWPFVGRVDNPYGDRNLVCTCPPMSEYAS
jgi:hypothetical protein